MENVLNWLTQPLAQMLIGGLITWAASQFFYIKASRELVAEIQKLKHLHDLTLRALEESGLTEYSRDEAGNFKGIKHSSAGDLVGSGSEMGGTSAGSANPPDNGRKS